MKLNKNFIPESRGNMLVELLLSVALAMTVVPFIFKYQQNAIVRAKNISVTKQMAEIQTALERYIAENRQELLKTVGKNITRIDLDDLYEYGIDPEFIKNNTDKYQLRILKSVDNNGKSSLQGIVILSDTDISPLRTRQLITMGENMGFVDGNTTYGSFGSWRSDSTDLGINTDDGIIQMTNINRDESLYLWRVPSNDSDDATMLSSLSLGGHDITNIKFLDSNSLTLNGFLNVDTIAAKDVTFQNRTTIDNHFETTSASVFGTFASDSRDMNIETKLTLADLGKFSNFVTNDLWTSNLTLSSISISKNDDDICSMKIGDRLDMTYGRVTAAHTTVGYAGSVTPKLVVSKLIQDSKNPDYFWDFDSGVANFYDVSIPDLPTMLKLAISNESNRTTNTTKQISGLVSNTNATVGDFLNAISDIEKNVRVKYQMLNLQ